MGRAKIAAKANWAMEEFNNLNLGDKRLNNRVVKIAEEFSEKPTAPINQACEDWADAKAAYRLFDNDKVKDEEIRRCHNARTIERMRAQPTVIAIQDKSFFSYNSHKKTKGLGNIGKCKNTKTQGLLMHSTLAVTPRGLPLGLVNQKTWARQPEAKREWDAKGIGKMKRLPVHAKESGTWVEALENTVRVCPVGVRLITVADREADIYEFIFKAFELKTEIVIRLSQDRNVVNEEKKLWDVMETIPIGGHLIIDVPAKDDRPKRQATVEVRFHELMIKPPARSKIKQATTVGIVWVKEVNPPEDLKEPLEWMLLTTMAVKSLADALEKIGWYKLRWHIESYHKVLKSGCRVEDCRLQTAERLERYLSLMCVVAWRMYWLTFMNRTHPDEPATVVLADHEWKALYCRIHKSNELPDKPPTVHQALRWVARLGGDFWPENAMASPVPSPCGGAGTG